LLTVIIARCTIERVPFIGELPLDATRIVRLTREGDGMRVAIIDTRTGAEAAALSTPDRSRESIARVAAAVRHLRAALVPQRWAEARWDDPDGELGAWLLTIDTERPEGAQPELLGASVVLPASLWWWSGSEWTLGASGRYLVGRAWLEADADNAVVRGLNAALLASSPVALASRDTAVFGATFSGTDGVAPIPRDALAAAAFDATARASCAKGTRRAKETDAIMRTLRREACGEGPVMPRGSCGTLLDALESSSTPPCDVEPSDVQCPRRLHSEDVEARLLAGTYDGPGPFETTRPHVAGVDLCCWFNPMTQDRLALQARVRAELFARDPEATDGELHAAFRAAEKRHPWREVWAACDARAKREAGAVKEKAGPGRQGTTEFQLWIAFINALRQGDERARGYWRRLQEADARYAPDDMPLDPSERGLWDNAHQAAHDSGIRTNIEWAHRTMRELNVPVIHAEKRRRFVSG
jgi:hypothetical protein